MTFRGNHVDELISASLTGDLTDAERAQLDAHLARCQKCRTTLTAFTAERRILSGLPMADPPRDLSARVRGGIEAGRLAGPWWRRPGSVVPMLASAAVFAAVVLAVVFFGKLQPGPVGQATGSPDATLSSTPSTGAVAAPSFPLGLHALEPGELGYLELTGTSFGRSQLSFINDATGAGIVAQTASGPPIAAALSPDGWWLAYITQKGETGANEIWVLSMSSGETTLVGCSLAIPFGDRLSWSPHGDLLAFTVSAIDLGANGGCPQPTDPDGTTRVWLFSVADLAAAPLMDAGQDSYTASFVPFAVPDAPNRLWVSHAGDAPSSELIAVGWPAVSVETLVKADGVFLPLISPDGNRALYWSGTMAQSNGLWQFSRGGMPQLSGDFRSVGPASPWLGTPLFTDLVSVGGEAFVSGDFAWSPDSDQFAFWDGAWTGAPQNSTGTYPSQQDVYFGQVSQGLLSERSRLVLDLPAGAWIVDVAFSDVAFSPDSPGGAESAVTIGLPSAGIGDPPSAYLQVVPLGSGRPHTIGGGVEPPPWDGPAVFGR